MTAIQGFDALTVPQNISVAGRWLWDEGVFEVRDAGAVRPPTPPAPKH